MEYVKLQTMMEDLEYFWNKEIQKASHFRRGRQDTQEG
jgi:hypothetical protein